MSSTGNCEQLVLDDGDVAPVTIRVDGRARRITLKVDRVGGRVTLTAPSEAALPDARRFMQKRAGWIAARRAAAHTIVPFAPGTAIPIFGVERVIQHAPKAVDPMRLTADAAIVGGAESAIARTLTAFLKAEALKRLKAATDRHAAAVGKPVARITVRDARTRWGSCASGGRLSFSWRLAMAPPHVLDYLSAHECAHLRHMNHGPDFWALVAELDPAWRAAEAWLNRHGPSLRRYG